MKTIFSRKVATNKTPNSGLTKNFDAKQFLKKISTHAGIYQMFNASGKLLYVGKAKNLKKRLASYFQKNQLDAKTKALMQQTDQIKIMITETEQAALILESEFIKKHHPKYNILFRDDKSYPYIFISEENFPRIAYYRGDKKAKGYYFGPYPGVPAVKKTLHLLEKIFLIRSCKNTFFSSRTRPCLQYQIERCSAPCVNLISEKKYHENIEHALMFLSGKSDLLIQQLIKKMDVASKQLHYELAAQYRNQIAALREIQKQNATFSKQADTDVIATAIQAHHVCVNVLMIRQNQIAENKTFFSSIPTDTDIETILTTFMLQYYLDHPEILPRNIVLPHQLKNKKLLNKIFAEKTKINTSPRKEKLKWLKMSSLNAEAALTHYLSKKTHYPEKLQMLKQIFHLSKTPKSIACFDVSHTAGQATIAAAILFTLEGPSKQNYKKFNVTNITPGDDFSALKQALNRYYQKLLREKSPLPDILIIDGGKGQLSIAKQILKQLDIKNTLLLGIAKGEHRKPGMETIYVANQKEPVTLDPTSKLFHLLQEIRDEAHRFAITAHRKKRQKQQKQSVLEKIPGIGPKKRQVLLKHFGGLQGIKKASVKDLIKVPGINKAFAERIYAVLR